MREIIVTRWLSDDGHEFSSPEECRQHERKRRVQQWVDYEFGGDSAHPDEIVDSILKRFDQLAEAMRDRD